MKKCRRIALLLAAVAGASVIFLPCPASETTEGEATIFDEPRGRRPDGGRYEFSDQENDRLLKAIRATDPRKATEIERLRKKDPKKFAEELKRNAPEEYNKIVGERVERWIERRRQERRAEFLDWLKTNVPEAAEELDKQKANLDLYADRYDRVYKKYGRVFEESRRHPEEAKVLLEDLKLQDRRDYLVNKIKRSKNEQEKTKLIAQLERVLHDRYDLIVIRKQMAYERLLRRLEELQSYIRKSSTEIEEAKKEEIKEANVKQRIKTLLEGNKEGILH